MIFPGNPIFVSDDGIEMEEYECQHMAGKIDWVLKYGLPDKENCEMRFKADLDIQMTDFGFVTTVVTAWKD